MEVFKEIPELQVFLKEKRNRNLKIGLVPTMGALHEGHFELIKQCKKESDITVCSIFVNPIQFNNSEDFLKYPRDFKKDIELLNNYGCDIVFIPEDNSMYLKDRVVNLGFGYLERLMEGKYRPGHFKGVGLVVLKLLNIIQPDLAYFGKKDLQQYVIIKRLVKELNLDTKIIGVETIRNKRGLALSSRNERLSEKEKDEALIFYHSLNNAKEELLQGLDMEKIKNSVESSFKNSGSAQLEYFEIVHSDTLRPIKNNTKKSHAGLGCSLRAGKID